MKIHKTAIVHPKSEIAADVEIGPYAIIGEHVKIGKGAKIEARVSLEGWTSIGENCEIHTNAIIGHSSTDLKYKGWRSYVIIGDRNVIREYVTISRATIPEKATIIGDDNLLMHFVNIAHDTVIGNGIIMANLATLAGHVVVEDGARIGAQAAVHQYVRIGKMAMAGACSKFVQDVPPFMLSDGHPAKVRGLNTIGLKSASTHSMRNLSPQSITLLKRTYKTLFRSNLNLSIAIQKVREGIKSDPDPEVEYLLNFIENSKRGIGF